MARAEELKFAGHEVTVNPENLRFDEDTLSKYIQTEAGFYDNFGAYLAMAERNLQNKEMAHEKIYCERFVEVKDDGGSDKLAENKSKCDPDVCKLKDEIIDARYIVNRLKNHLKAWDKNHDNAQSMGHMLRKQMDKLNMDIMGGSNSFQHHPFSGLDVESIKKTEVKHEEPSGEFETNLSLENMF